MNRQLTYRVPFAPCTRTAMAQELIAQQAIELNGSCYINYEGLHNINGIHSTMVLTMTVGIEHCDYVHRGMQKAIKAALSIYSPDITIVHVTDEPVMTRHFNCEDL